jgi:phosphoserine phosphatase
MKKGKKKPLVIKKETIAPFDCDMTLIDYDIDGRDKADLVKMGLNPIKKHIQTLINMKAGDFYIIVWSASGSAWAKHVVEKLGLNDYVDLVISKPRFYTDDEDARNWMKRLYYYKK